MGQGVFGGARKFLLGKRKKRRGQRRGSEIRLNQLKFCTFVNSSLTGPSYGTDAWISQLWDICEFTEKGNLL